nr:TonB-dependent siderophore receptor [uncultured Duganella sp.]
MSTPRLTSLNQCLRAALVVLSLGTGLKPLPVLAATPANAGVASYQVTAGPLDEALASFATMAGISVQMLPAMVAGRNTPGVSGRMTVAEGFAVLLAGSGLEAEDAGGGVWVLRAARAGDSLPKTLAPVTVTAQVERNGPTEGTGSYVSAAPLTTATPLGLTLRETPQSVSVITTQRLEDQGLTTIQQTLAQVPGVRTGSLGSELGNASSRGYSFNNYQFDGLNTYVEVLGGGAVPSSTLADMALYDRIEVLRGASGLVTGAGDPSGTINMVRKKPIAEFQSAAELSIGSWNNKRIALDVSAPLNETRNVRGRLIAVGQDADSYIDNYGRKKGILYGVIEADLGSVTRLTAGVEHERTKVKGQGAYVGFPLWYSNGTRTDLPVSFTAASRDNWLDLESTKAFVMLEHELGGEWYMKLSASRAHSSQEDARIFLRFNNNFANQAGNGILLNASQRKGSIDQENADLNVRGPFTLFGRQHQLVLGATYEDYDQPIDTYSDTNRVSGTAANLFTWARSGTAQYGVASVIGRYIMRQSSVYGAARFQVSDQLKLIAGTRVFSHDYRFAEYWTGGSYGTRSSEDGVITPYGGVVYDVDKIHSLYASYATIYKPQVVRDRFGAVLDPVEGANYEAGVKSAWLDGALNTSIAVYQIRQDNLAEADAGYTVPGTTSTAAYRAVEGARTSGMDLEVSGALTPDWNVSASWTYGQTKNARGERINTTFPRQMVKLWTTYRLSGSLHRLTVGGGLNWQSRTYSTVNAWQIGRDLHWEQKAYAVADLMARYDFNDKLSATLNVSNLLDKRYIASVSDWWYAGMYGSPRSAALNLKYKF